MRAPSREVLELLGEVLGHEGKTIALHEPEVGESERESIEQCLDSGYVSTVGPSVVDFERRIAEITGAAFAVSTSSGTAALAAALRVAGTEPNDHVLVPALTFVGTANAASQLGALPHFLDCNRETLGMCPDGLRRYLRDRTLRRNGRTIDRNSGARIAAVVPVHVFGLAADAPEIVSICDEYGLPVVEDAAGALGTRIGDRHVGTFGLCGIISFNGNKIVTTGGGGVVLTSDEETATRIRHLTSTARVQDGWRLSHDAVAWNYRMPALNASLGIAQLGRLPEHIARKRLLAHRYASTLDGSQHLSFVKEREGTRSNYWLSTIRVQAQSYETLDEVLSVANNAGYQCRPAWTPLNELPMYRTMPAESLAETSVAAAQLLNLPSSPSLLQRSTCE